MELAEHIQRRVTVGDTREVVGHALRLECTAWTARWPRWRMVWNRPSAVYVDCGGWEERLPIVDVTRLAQWACLGLALLFAGISMIYSIKERSK